MFFLITAVITIWLFWKWLQLKKIIEVSRQVKCKFRAFPLIGHGHMFAGNGVRRMEAFISFGREALKQCGMTNLWLGSHYFLVIADPVDMNFVSKSCLEKGDLMRFARNLIGNGTIFAPVSIWHPRRKILAPIFRLNNLNSFVKIFYKNSILMVDQLNGIAGKESFSIWKYLTTYTMNSVCETAMGVDMSLKLRNNSSFFKSFGKICEMVAERTVSPWLHSDRVYNMLPRYETFCKNRNILCGFVDEMIKFLRSSLESESANKNKGKENKIKTFLELMIESSGGKNGYSDIELREEILVILLAGTDTSAVGASFISLMLSKHQDVQEKVYQELQEVLGNSNRNLEYQDLPHLKYLEAVITETLRLYPPVPVIVRKVETNVTLPSGIKLVPGCGVMLHIWAVQRNPHYWGPDAELFRPERFFDSPATHPSAYMAFSSGPRNCLGYQYAMMSMKTAIATLVRRFHILQPKTSPGADNSDFQLVYNLMMKDADQFNVQLECRL